LSLHVDATNPSTQHADEETRRQEGRSHGYNGTEFHNHGQGKFNNPADSLRKWTIDWEIYQRIFIN
jgi:hypothetical protein